MFSRKAPVEVRLERHSIPEPNSGCLLWLAKTNKTGYGVVGWRRKSALAHRVAWAVKNGPIPDGMFVCHKCDVPACINPAHLFLGTNADNMRDMAAKGRSKHPRWAEHPLAKLTLDEVRSILADSRKQREIAASYGIAASTVAMIKTRRNWRDL